MRMYSTDLIDYLARTHRRSRPHYRAALDEILAGITEQLSRGHSVTFIDFGTFYLHQKPAAKVKHVRTGKEIRIPAHTAAAFHVADRLKRAVRTASSPSATPHKRAKKK